MTTTTSDLEIRTYIAAVAARLSDLDPDERDELMADLEQHLREVAAEGEGRLSDWLGSPESYAAELRASAGLPVVPPSDGDGGHKATIRERVVRLTASPTARRVANVFREIRPGWWVVRAGIVTVAFLTAALSAVTMQQLILYSLVAFPAFAALSWWLGRAASHNGVVRTVSTLGSFAAVILGFVVLATIEARMSPVYYSTVDMPAYLHHETGEPISNVCAYDTKLRPIEEVLLFDQNGKPITNVAAPWSAELQDTARGFANAYPREHWGMDGVTGEQVPHDFECPTLASEAPKKK